ncbi:MAG: hypothetical protein JST86_20410 [Bacteroidetes bacterium]|nr:hypothetical protein [Bacteroidota bacterium]
MRDTKSLSLLLLSSVLFLLSIILLGTWGYQYYHQLQEDKTKQEVAKAAPATVPDSTRDSLLTIYKNTISGLDSKLDTAWYYADSLRGNLDLNLKEFYRLRTEISTLLQAKSPSNADLDLAKKKISQLQLKVTQLRYRNSDVEAENERLRALLAQMNKETQDAEDNSRALEKENKTLTAKVNAISNTISAANLNLAALANNDQQETTVAGQTEKLVGSFTLKSNLNGKCDIMIVVVQPNGQVLQKSAWESGSFETNDGKKVYSCKIRCETSKGENKQYNFSLTAEKFYKGNYIMQVYHNGVLLAKFNKALS